MDAFQAASDRFLAWFKSMGGTFRDDLIEIKDLRARGAGRGIVAKKSIQKDCVLFTIPRSAMINVETSNVSKLVPGIFDGVVQDNDTDTEPLDPWISLILVLLYEYLQGEASPWAPYLAILPDVFDTPIFWSPSELEELKGTCLTEEKIGRKESDNMLKSKVLPLVKKHQSVFYRSEAQSLSDEELLYLAHRIGSTIMAYAFDLENDPSQSDEDEDGWTEDREGNVMLGMVPMADMLNADAEFNTHVNHGDDLEVNSLRSEVVAGTEILNYYGPLPSSELLRRYGYLTAKHQRYDVVEVTWDDVMSSLIKHLDIPSAAAVQATEQMDTDEMESSFVIERDVDSPDEEGRLHGQAKLTEICPELEEQFDAYVRKLKKIMPSAAIDKRKRGQILDSVMQDVLQSKLSSYPTTIREDETILQQPNLSTRYKMAVRVRLGEKHLLQEALSLVQNKATTNSTEDVRSVKKSRT